MFALDVDFAWVLQGVAILGLIGAGLGLVERFLSR